jgi:hypothetical protein
MSSAEGINGLFAGEPEAIACSTIVGMLSSHASLLIPYASGVGT